MTKQKSKKPSEIKAYNLAKTETDTYKKLTRQAKENITRQEVVAHWETRARRRDVQSVMSARHSLKENKEAARQLKEAIFAFLGDEVAGKRVFELGVGIGRMTEEIAKRAASVTGNDISVTMLKKARRRLKNFQNVDLRLGKIDKLDLPPKSFDLVFDSIVLLHILNPEELQKTVAAIQRLSDTIFLVEHTYEGEDFPISKFSILRPPEEYKLLFQPYNLIKQKTHLCAGDTFTLFLFKAP